MAKPPLERKLLVEIASGMLGEGALPTEPLRKALAKASGKTEQEILDIIKDEYYKLTGEDIDPYQTLPPQVG